MGVIKQERDGLDRVLRRYVATGTVDAVLAEVEGGWHAVTATPWSPVSSTSRIERVPRIVPSAAAPTPHRATGQRVAGVADPITLGRFRVVPDRSVVMINARSSVGPITFGAIGVTGFIEAAVAGRRVCSTPSPTAHLEIDVEHLRSGNSLYDAELLRRIDARRHPDRRARPAGVHCARAPPIATSSPERSRSTASAGRSTARSSVDDAVATARW